jgi:hypothetical protein
VHTADGTVKACAAAPCAFTSACLNGGVCTTGAAVDGTAPLAPPTGPGGGHRRLADGRRRQQVEDKRAASFTCTCADGFTGPRCAESVLPPVGPWSATQDRVWLLAFKASGNGAGLESWTMDGEPCAGGWAGVTCEDGAVTAVQLGKYPQPYHGSINPAWDNDLTGGLAKLAGLVRLRMLILSYTVVAGDISSLSALADLWYLGLGSTAAAGDLSSLSTMTELTTLRLSLTAVAGDLSSLANLAALTTLYLENVAVTGDLSSLSAMVVLSTLGLRSTAVVGDVSGLSTMSSLSTLYLEGTAVTGWPLVTAGGKTFADEGDHSGSGTG